MLFYNGILLSNFMLKCNSKIYCGVYWYNLLLEAQLNTLRRHTSCDKLSCAIMKLYFETYKENYNFKLMFYNVKNL